MCFRMDATTCSFVAASDKYHNSVIMLRAFKIVVESIAMAEDVKIKQVWASCLKKFDVNKIGWNNSSIDMVLILATCLPPLSSGQNDLYNNISTFLNELKNADVYIRIAKLMKDRMSALGVTEWTAIRNLCSVVLVPPYFERCALETMGVMLQQYLKTIKTANYWRDHTTALDMIIIESSIISTLCLLKVRRVLVGA
jgi:hypothetical protein